MPPSSTGARSSRSPWRPGTGAARRGGASGAHDTVCDPAFAGPTTQPAGHISRRHRRPSGMSSAKRPATPTRPTPATWPNRRQGAARGALRSHHPSSDRGGPRATGNGCVYVIAGGALRALDPACACRRRPTLRRSSGCVRSVTWRASNLGQTVQSGCRSGLHSAVRSIYQSVFPACSPRAHRGRVATAADHPPRMNRHRAPHHG